MGRGPQELIYKKLIKTYLKFNLKGGIKGVDSLIVPQALNAVEKYGRNSAEANQIFSKLNKNIEKEEKIYQQLKKEVYNYPAIVDSYLYKVRPKNSKQGRYHIPADYYYVIEKDNRKLDI